LAEWLIRTMSTEKGKTLLKYKGLSSKLHAQSILRVLFCYIGGNSHEDLAFLCRAMPGVEIDEVFKAGFEDGLKLLQTIFQLSDADAILLRDYTSFRKSDFAKHWRAAYKSHGVMAERQLALRLKANKDKLNPKGDENPKVDILNEDVPMDDR